jgi:hypothetical protein
LGRSASAHVCFTQADISQRHAVVGYHPGSDAWSITDIGSTNGTWLKAELWREAKRLTVGDPYPINPGAVFWLGTNRVVVAEEDFDTFPNNIWQFPTEVADPDPDGSETAILLPAAPPTSAVVRTPPDILPPSPTDAPPTTDAQAVLAWVGKLPLWAQLALLAVASGLVALWLTR